jgi:hypothetical protein
MLPAIPMVLLLAGCSDYIILQPTATPAPVQSLPPIGFNHRYGNDPLSAADGFTVERTLFSKSEFWEVGVAIQPDLVGYVDRTNPAAVARARAKITQINLAIATERINTIKGMIAFPDHSGQEQYCIEVVDLFRALGYTALTKVTMIVFFTESDQHAQLTWSPKAGYTFRVFDNDLRGTSINAGSAALTPLPAPG